MNRTLTVGMFAGIFAIAMGAFVLNGDSASTFMVSAMPQTQETMGMIGHVEYIVRDNAEQIKAYKQTDNIVTEEGRNCVGLLVFNDAGAVEDCAGSTQFQYVAIGNFTAATPDGTEQALDADSGATAGCATDAANGEGEMARKLVTPTFLTTGSDTQVVLDTSSDPFQFRANNATSATTVFQSGIFNADNTTKDATHGHCTDSGSADMFAIQELNTSTGISVTSGDSLSVKWTITIGTT